MKHFEKEYNHIERWKHLRKNCFRNVEPTIELVAITQPLPKYADKGLSTEALPAYTARASHESKGTPDDDLRLNSKLISMGHHTCLEAVQFVYLVTGISKSLAGQWTRHRAGIGWTFRSTRYVKASENGFVYPALEYINDDKRVVDSLRGYEDLHIQALKRYDALKDIGVKNQELRRLMPVGFATSAYVYVNARAMRHFFELRLDSHAEWEIRRLAILFFNDVMERTPSLFADLAK